MAITKAVTILSIEEWPSSTRIASPLLIRSEIRIVLSREQLARQHRMAQRVEEAGYVILVMVFEHVDSFATIHIIPDACP